MNTDKILSFIQDRQQKLNTLGTYVKIIGSDPGWESDSVLLVITKSMATTAEEAYALFLIDEANTERSMFRWHEYKDKPLAEPKINFAESKTLGTSADWNVVEKILRQLNSTGVDIPVTALDIPDNAKLQEKDLRQAFVIYNDWNLRQVVLETEKSYVIMDWSTSA